MKNVNVLKDRRIVRLLHNGEIVMTTRKLAFIVIALAILNFAIIAGLIWVAAVAIKWVIS